MTKKQFIKTPEFSLLITAMAFMFIVGGFIFDNTDLYLISFLILILNFVWQITNIIKLWNI